MSLENRPAEREALERHGRLALEDAARHEPQEAVRDLRPLIRLWHYPAFFAHTSWTVFEPLDEESRTRLVRQVRWDRPRDLLRFSDPLEGVKQGLHAPPSVSVRDVRVGDNVLRGYLHELSGLPIPVVGIETPIGLDGETFGLQLYGHFLAAQLQWWGEGPPAWSAFTSTIARLRTHLIEQHV